MPRVSLEFRGLCGQGRPDTPDLEDVPALPHRPEGTVGGSEEVR